MQDLLDMVLTALHQEREVWNFYHDFFYEIWIFLYMYYLAVTPHVIPLRASFLEDLFAKLVFAIRQSPYQREKCGIFSWLSLKYEYYSVCII